MTSPIGCRHDAIIAAKEAVAPLFPCRRFSLAVLRHSISDALRGDFGFQRMLGQMMGGLPEIRRHDDGVMRGTKSGRGTQPSQFRMIPPGDTQIAAEIKALPR
jgi:hypothetical protein